MSNILPRLYFGFFLQLNCKLSGLSVPQMEKGSNWFRSHFLQATFYADSIFHLLLLFWPPSVNSLRSSSTSTVHSASCRKRKICCLERSFLHPCL